MIPDFNNVYGHVIAPQGLQPVVLAVNRVIGERLANIKKSQFNGAETLHFSTDALDFHSTPLDSGSRHLLNGGVGGSLEDVAAFVQALSRSLAKEGIVHRFEVYDDDQNLVQRFPV